MRQGSSALQVSRWVALMDRVQINQNLPMLERLRAAYAERHRHYHTAGHINQCLAELDAALHLAAERDEVELALWFHDAVYITRRSDNEAQSAALAAQFLAANAVTAERVQRVRDLVLATKHDAADLSADAALLVDIDLSILGADSATYDRFEHNVRKEYWWVPSLVFRQKRATILESFLSRRSVFNTDYFRNRLEQAARRNLGAAIATLRAGS